MIVDIWTHDGRKSLGFIEVPADTKKGVDRWLGADPLFGSFIKYRVVQPIPLEEMRARVEEEYSESATPARVQAVRDALGDDPLDAQAIKDRARERSGLSYGHGNQILGILQRHARKTEDGWVRKGGQDAAS